MTHCLPEALTCRLLDHDRQTAITVVFCACCRACIIQPPRVFVLALCLAVCLVAGQNPKSFTLCSSSISNVGRHSWSALKAPRRESKAQIILASRARATTSGVTIAQISFSPFAKLVLDHAYDMTSGCIVAAVGTRTRLGLYSQHCSIQTRASALGQWLQRWERNKARLYARHVLQIAAASAATQRYRAQLEEKFIDKPIDWLNWERKDWTDDLMQSIGASKLQRSWSAISRIFSLSVLWSPMAILYPLSLVSETAASWSWAYALWGIEKSGPFALKLTQWATTRQDLFSPEFCQYFGKLRDDTVGHAWHHTTRILAEDLGELASWLDLEKVPIGSGCVAQVYRGKLNKSVNQYPTGTEVAIKVQHPGIWYKVCIDFYIMGKIAGFLEAIPRLNLTYLSLVDTVRQFRDIMVR